LTVFVLQLNALYIRGARTLVRLFGVKGNLVAFAKFGKGDADERRAVKKDILVAAVRGDETKTLFSVDALDCSVHMFEYLLINSANSDLFAEISTNFQEGVICCFYDTAICIIW
jgi:hypothetical protein